MGDIADQMVEQAESNYDRRPRKHGKSKDKTIYPKYRGVTTKQVLVDTEDLKHMITIVKQSGRVQWAIGIHNKYLREEIK